MIYHVGIGGANPWHVIIAWAIFFGWGLIAGSGFFVWWMRTQRRNPHDGRNPGVPRTSLGVHAETVQRSPEPRRTAMVLAMSLVLIFSVYMLVKDSSPLWTAVWTIWSVVLTIAVIVGVRILLRPPDRRS